MNVFRAKFLSRCRPWARVVRKVRRAMKGKDKVVGKAIGRDKGKAAGADRVKGEAETVDGVERSAKVLAEAWVEVSAI